ncbi:hypothetical protein HT031_000717 [Scenedesmus sp. PABB004]|nr:hypothetical protein HT031_000717 [Scenedesmus sp. PABB004]
MALELVVLGVGAGATAVYGDGSGGASCSSAFLLLHGGRPLLQLDLGLGATRATRATGAAEVAPAIYVSHNHTDHAGELPVVLAVESQRGRRLKVLAEPGVLRTLTTHRLAELASTGRPLDAFAALTPCAAGQLHDLGGGLGLLPLRARHAERCFGLLLFWRGAPVLGWSGDSGYDARLYASLAAAPLLLLDGRPGASSEHAGFAQLAAAAASGLFGGAQLCVYGYGAACDAPSAAAFPGLRGVAPGEVLTLAAAAPDAAPMTLDGGVPRAPRRESTQQEQHARPGWHQHRPGGVAAASTSSTTGLPRSEETAVLGERAASTTAPVDAQPPAPQRAVTMAHDKAPGGAPLAAAAADDQHRAAVVAALERKNGELRAQLCALREGARALEASVSAKAQVIKAQDAELADKARVIEQLRARLARLGGLASALADEAAAAGAAAAAAPFPDAKALLGQELPRLPALKQQQHNAAAAAEAGACGGAAAAAAGGGMRLPAGVTTMIGAKRARLCSATGSGGGDAAPGAPAAPGSAGAGPAPKRATSGGSGSSSSRQPLSGDEEEGGEEVDCECTAGGCLSSKRQRSPGSSARVSPGEGDMCGQGGPAEEEEEEEEEDDKSQDDLDAAECLQQLAMSSGPEPAPPRAALLGGGSHLLPTGGRSGSSVTRRPGGPAGAGLHGSSASSGSAGLGALQAQLLHQHQAYPAAQAAPAEAFESLRSASHPRKPSAFSAQAAQQAAPAPKALPQFGGALRRAESWGAGRSGSMGAPSRARKQSWFQTEIAEKIPLSVQQACATDWGAQQCMPVVCADLGGTFYVNPAGEYLIKLASSGEVVTPNKFEELAGKKTARNWQQSIRLVGYTMNGEPNSALLKLGHFTRIVGLVQDR